MSESRLLSKTDYRGYVVDLVETTDGRFARVWQGDTVVAGFKDSGNLDAINRACEWVERQTVANG